MAWYSQEHLSKNYLSCYFIQCQNFLLLVSFIFIKGFFYLKSHVCFQEWKRPSLILESINKLAWVNVPEYPSAFLKNRNGGFGIAGHRKNEFWFMVTSRKDVQYVGYYSGILLNPINRIKSLRGNRGVHEWFPGLVRASLVLCYIEMVEGNWPTSHSLLFLIFIHLIVLSTFLIQNV